MRKYLLFFTISSILYFQSVSAQSQILMTAEGMEGDYSYQRFQEVFKLLDFDFDEVSNAIDQAIGIVPSGRNSTNSRTRTTRRRGRTNASNGSGRLQSQRTVPNVVLERKMSTASPGLLDKLFKGQIIPEMEVFSISNGTVAQKVIFENVSITGFKNDSKKKAEEISISYNSVKYQTFESGKMIEKGWNYVTNERL